VAELSHGSPKAKPWGLRMLDGGRPCANQPGRQSARLDVTGRFFQVADKVDQVSGGKTSPGVHFSLANTCSSFWTVMLCSQFSSRNRVEAESPTLRPKEA